MLLNVAILRIWFLCVCFYFSVVLHKIPLCQKIACVRWILKTNEACKHLILPTMCVKVKIYARSLLSIILITGIKIALSWCLLLNQFSRSNTMDFHSRSLHEFIDCSKQLLFMFCWTSSQDDVYSISDLLNSNYLN